MAMESVDWNLRFPRVAVSILYNTIFVIYQFPSHPPVGNPVTGEGYRPGLTDYEEYGQKHRRLGESKTDRY